MKVIRKSLHRSRNAKHAKKRANQRAAKERKRIARAVSPAPYDDYPFTVTHTHAQPSGFRVTIECLDDGERVQFTTVRGPHGLTISPTLAGQRVFAVLRHYLPAKLHTKAGQNGRKRSNPCSSP